MLHGAEGIHREVLGWTARAAEPRVVRHVDHEAGTILDKLSHKLRKDALITDHDAEGSGRAGEDDGTRAGLEIGDELRPATDESEQRGQGHVLAKGNKLDLIISVLHAVRRDQERAVAV